MKNYKLILITIGLSLLFCGCGAENKATNEVPEQIDNILAEKEISLSKVDGSNISSANTENETDNSLDSANKDSNASDTTINPASEKEDVVLENPVPFIEKYSIALDRILNEGILPNGRDCYGDMVKTGMDKASVISDFGEMSENEFAIADVDEDGKVELIILFKTAPEAFKYCSIFEVNPDTEEYVEEVTIPGEGAVFYTDGIIKQPWTHNDELGGDELWPYQILDYNESSDIYDYAGRVDSWSKAMHPEDYENIKFPDDVDTDHVGVVYDLSYGEDYTGGYVYSQSEFNEFENKVFGIREEIMIEYKKINQDNIQLNN